MNETLVFFYSLLDWQYTGEIYSMDDNTIEGKVSMAKKDSRNKKQGETDRELNQFMSRTAENLIEIEPADSAQKGIPIEQDESM